MKITEKQINQLMNVCNSCAINPIFKEEYRDYCHELLTEIIDQQSNELQEIK